MPFTNRDFQSDQIDRDEEAYPLEDEENNLNFEY